MTPFINAYLLKLLDATLGYIFCRFLGRLRHHLGRPELAPTPDFRTLKRILIIRPGGMGDMLMLLPMLHAIREHNPNVIIDIVCETRNFEVLELAGLTDHAMLYDGNPIRFLRSLHRADYEVVIDSEQFHNFSAVIAWLSGAPVRVGFKINPTRLSLYTHLVSYDIDGYEMDQFENLLRPFGVSLDHQHLHGVLGASDTRLQDRIPADAKPLIDKGRIIVVAPGSSNSYKQWGPEKFAEMITRLNQTGCSFILVGGKHDVSKDVALRARADTLVDCCARLSLMETAAILNSATVFVGCDSGLTHLTTALGKPTVAIFGPSDSGKWNDDHAQHVVVRKNLPCSPCSIFGYNKLCRDVPCMSNISVDDVVTAVTTLLDSETVGQSSNE
jgi:ADP-heptose:LPS heptosyltransferase